MLNVYLLRHGETHYNADGNRYCGRTDVGLTEIGMSQARSVSTQLQGIKFDAIYSSPLNRAAFTAEVASGNKSVVKDDRLIEVDFGDWEGKTRGEFMLENPNNWNSWIADPAEVRAGGCGETGAMVVERVDAFYADVLQTFPNGHVLVVAHNGVNRLYLAYKLGMPLRNYQKIVQENSAITLFELEADGELTLKLLNSKIS